MASEKYANNAVTTLNGSISSGATTLVVTSASLFPASGQFRIAIESEILLVTGVSGTTFTVTRGQEGTSGASHADTTAVTQVLTKGALDQVISDNCQYGASASRPSAEKAGRLYFANDYPVWHRDNGSSWDSFYEGKHLTFPITSDFSWTNGGGTATNTDVTNGGTFLSVTSSAAGDKSSIFTKSIPTAPYSISSMFIPEQSPVQYTWAGMVLYDGTKLVFFLVLYQTAGVYISLEKYSNITTYSADYMRVLTPTHLNPVCLGIADDATNRVCSYSNDGYNFLPIHSVGNTDFLTPTKIGMVVGTSTGTTSNGASNKGSMNWLSWKE